MSTALIILKCKDSLLLPDDAIGPFCFYLLLALFCISLVLLTISLWRHSFREEALQLDVYVTVANLHLILRYNDMLHTLTSVTVFQTTILFYTAVVVSLAAAAIGITVLIKSINQRQ